MTVQSSLSSDQTEGLPEGFEVVGCWADGSFAEICQVRETKTGELAAWKRLRPEWRNHPEARRLFRVEAEATRNTNGDHIVCLKRADLEGKSPWLLLEWLEGETLEQLLENSVQIPVSSAVWFARQVAEGLHCLANAGFVHGDLKPENIFITPTGLVKLIDLGFSHRIDQPTGLPEQKLLMGTAEYLAPESLTAERSNPVAKDVYSLGVILFRMLAGKLPFTGQSTADILRLQRQAKPLSLNELCPLASEKLVDLVHRMLAKQPLRRPVNLTLLTREFVNLELELLAASPVDQSIGKSGASLPHSLMGAARRSQRSFSGI